MRVSLSGRPMAVGIVLAALATEMLPVVFGTGDRAVVDWSFLYVTSKFIVLPVLCFLHIGRNLWKLVAVSNSTLSDRAWDLGATVMPVAYLALLFLRPEPLFGF